jgi:hypothetical protein
VKDGLGNTLGWYIPQKKIILGISVQVSGVGDKNSLKPDTLKTKNGNKHRKRFIGPESYWSKVRIRIELLCFQNQAF